MSRRPARIVSRRRKRGVFHKDGQVAHVEECGFTDGDAVHIVPVRGGNFEPQSSSGPPSSSEGSSSGGSSSGPAPSSSGGEVTEQWARVDLGAVQPISLVVVRQLIPAGFVEYSADGVEFTALGSGAAQQGTFKIDVPSTVMARYVRVRAQSAIGLHSISEISVW